MVATLHQEVQHLRQERSSRVPLPPGRKPQPRSTERQRSTTETLQPRSREPVPEVPPYDPAKFILGRLCPRKHRI
jgi:hypothetical protein